MALYLKYRPQSLDQLIGQEAVKKTLSAAYSQGKLSHAYLFVGPRGTGKTSTARILAKMVNCEAKEGLPRPCNECATCISITDGSNLDLVEIDAASNRGIDDIRALRDTIKLSPTNSKKKVYIIDEVHMLTTEAFNALLKTLEDPPQHVIFILATTEAQKIPQTILSRTQRLDFNLATSIELETALQNIIDAEKISIEPDALKVLIKKADGSFRDGVKLLDQISSSGEKITQEGIFALLKVAPFETVIQFIKALLAKDAKTALQISSQLASAGEVKDCIFSVMDVARGLLLIKNDLGEVLVKPLYSEEEYKMLQEVSKDAEITQIAKILDELQTALEKMKYTSLQSLPLELGIVEVCSIQKNKAVQQIEEKAVEIKPEDREIERKEENIEVSPALKIEVGDEVVILQEKWNVILETIKPDNFSLEALLRTVKILDCKEGSVLLEVPYSFHQRILETPKSRDLLESVLSDVLGKPVRVSCVLASKPLKVEDIANVELALDDEVIRAAAEIFGAETVN